jgi:hypothetical protein
MHIRNALAGNIQIEEEAKIGVIALMNLNKNLFYYFVCGL